MMKRSQELGRMIGVSHLKMARKRLEICHSSGKVTASIFWRGYSRHLIHQFSDRTMKHQSLKVSRRQERPDFRSKRRGRSVKSVCLLHDNARPHTAAVTTGTLEVLPHPAYSYNLASSYFNLFGPLKDALERKKI